MKLLLVDDDADLLGVTGFALQQAGYLVVTAATAPAALATFERERPDLVLLDINLPGGSGFEVCRQVRRDSRVPVMMLTARGEEEDLVRALEMGADDYLTKPFSPRTLIARVRALLRRAGAETSGRTTVGELELDADALQLRIAGAAGVRVTRLEFRLLQLLFAHAGQTIPADRLLAHVWGHKGGGDRQVLKQLVHRLRQKLLDAGQPAGWLETVPGLGYRIVTAADDSRA